jgi:hypothetical protein
VLAMSFPLVNGLHCVGRTVLSPDAPVIGSSDGEREKGHRSPDSRLTPPGGDSRPVLGHRLAPPTTLRHPSPHAPTALRFGIRSPYRFIVKLKALRKPLVVIMRTSTMPSRLRSCPRARLYPREKSLADSKILRMRRLSTAADHGGASKTTVGQSRGESPLHCPTE